MNGDTYIRDRDEPPITQPLSCRRLSSTNRLGSGRNSSGRLGGGGFGGRRRISPQNSDDGSDGEGRTAVPPHRSASAPTTYAMSSGRGGGECTGGGMSPSHASPSSPSSSGNDHQSTPRLGSSFALSSLRSIQDALDFKFVDEERHWQFAEKNVRDLG